VTDQSHNPGVSAGRKRPIWRRALEEHGALIALVLLVAFSAAQSETFLKPENLLNILRQVAPVGIIALGMTFVIISGGIDLSVGAMMALIGGIAVLAMNAAIGAGSGELGGVLIAVGVCLLGGPLLGMLNGLLVAKGRIAPFIVTLATMAAFRSLALSAADGGEFRSATRLFGWLGREGVPVPFLEVAPGMPLKVGFSVLAFFALAAIAHIVLWSTRYGRYVVAVGSNERAAVYSGLNVQRIKMLTFTLSGLMCGIAGLFIASRMNAVSSSQTGVLYELDAIAAVVIGGTLMTGGRGSIRGTVVGVLLLGVIGNMLNMFNKVHLLGAEITISTYTQGMVKGLIILAAVLVQRGRRN
jgi:ribose transport system permease protein